MDSVLRVELIIRINEDIKFKSYHSTILVPLYRELIEAHIFMVGSHYFPKQNGHPTTHLKLVSWSGISFYEESIIFVLSNF